MDNDAGIERITWKQKLHRLVPPTVSAFLCFLFVVITPLKNLGGFYGFLTYTAAILFFFPEGGLLHQIEKTVLGVVGGTLGLAFACGWLAIAGWCGGHYGSDTIQARAVNATGLAVLSFLCGFARSYSPRLNEFSRISLFFPIFLMTDSPALTEIRSFYFTDSFATILAAAVFSLGPAVLFGFQSSSRRLGFLIVKSLETTCELLPISLSTVLEFREEPATSLPSPTADDLEKTHDEAEAKSRRRDTLSAQLRESVRSLASVYRGYTHEITYDRASPTALAPLITSIRRLHKNPILGPSSHVPGERIKTAIHRAYDATLSVPPSVPSTPRVSSMPGRRDSLPMIQTPEEDHAPEPASRAMTTSMSSPLSLRRKLYVLGDGHRRTRSMLSTSPDKPLLVAASNHLVETIQKAAMMSLGELTVIYRWKTPVGVTGPSDTTRPTLKDVKHDLETALSELQKRLAQLLDGLGGQPHHVPMSESKDSLRHDDYHLRNGSPFRRGGSAKDLSIDTSFEYESAPDRDLFRLAFYMTSLLDLAKDVLALLFVVISISQQAEKKRRWLLPRPSWAWFKGGTFTSATAPGAQYKRQQFGQEENEMQDKAQRPNVFGMDYVTATLHREKVVPSSAKPKSWLDRLENAFRIVWDNKGVLRGRVILSHALHTVRHSPHVLFSIKMAFGVSLLCMPAYFPPNTRARWFWDRYRGAWTSVSYMMVLEVHTGATLTVGFYREAGTFIGAVTAFVLNIISKTRPNLLVALATICSIPLSYGILFSNHPQLPTVTSITLPPLLFLHYLHMDKGQSHFDLAWTRFVDITIGIVAAILVSLLIWPNHARVRYFLAVSSTFDRATQYYLNMSRDNLRPSLIYQADPEEYTRLEADFREHLRLSRTLIAIQRRETSLLPRPIRLYTEVVDCLERLIDAFEEVRVLRFSVPRKATVLDVLPLRRELVSSILINLWALGQSFRSRSALPQYLPSPRVALDGIMEVVDEHARRIRRRTRHDHEDNGTSSSRGDREELSVLYAMAENEAIGEVCNILDELVAAAQTLFGSRTFVPVGDVGDIPEFNIDS